MVDDLLNKPIWQMTGAEFLSLLQSSIKSSEDKAPIVSEEREKVKRYEYGIRGIAKIFGCSIPTANRIKKSGKINAAITQVGRKIIVDADLALQLAKNIKTM
jgi:DNA invertase Pin-like site-specific DNA recombinase